MLISGEHNYDLSGPESGVIKHGDGLLRFLYCLLAHESAQSHTEGRCLVHRASTVIQIQHMGSGVKGCGAVCFPRERL